MDQNNAIQPFSGNGYFLQQYLQRVNQNNQILAQHRRRLQEQVAELDRQFMNAQFQVRRELEQDLQRLQEEARRGQMAQ